MTQGAVEVEQEDEGRRGRTLVFFGEGREAANACLDVGGASIGTGTVREGFAMGIHWFVWVQRRWRKKGERRPAAMGNERRPAGAEGRRRQLTEKMEGRRRRLVEERGGEFSVA